MAYIFLDESGDLGFDRTKKGTSRYFVITFLFVPDSKRPLEKLARTVHAGLTKKVKRQTGVLHAVKENDATRRRLLTGLKRLEYPVMSIYLDKTQVYTKQTDEKAILYNFITNILLSRIYAGRLIPADKPIQLIASRRETNRLLNETFKTYLEKQVKQDHQGNLTVSIHSPSEEKGLQVVDFVSWAIFRKYEHADATFYRLIKANVVEERALYE